MLNKKKVLVLNNSWSEYDLLTGLLKNNFKVFTCGLVNPYVKKNINHIKIDYRNHKFINQFIKKNKIEYVFPGANDLTLFTLAKLKFKNKLSDKTNVINILHDKFLFRKFYKKIKFYDLKNLNLKKIKFPILLKARKKSTGRGIKLINDKKILKNILKNTDSKNFFLEKYIEGSDHGVFTLVKNNQVIFSFFDTEQRFINPYLVSSTIGHTNIPNKIKNEFIDEVNLLIKKLNLTDGILHFQIKFKKKIKKILIVEVTRRIPGDMYLRFAELSTGYPIIKNLIKIYERKKINNNHIKTKYFVFRKMLLCTKNGFIKKIFINQNLNKNIVTKKIFYKKNSYINNYYYQRLGVIILKFIKKKKIYNLLKNLNNFFHVDIR